MQLSVGRLGAVADLLLRALALQGIWVLGTLAGGIVLGWAPATMAAYEAAHRAEHGRRISLAGAARTWRRFFWRSQLTLAMPAALLLLAIGTALAAGAPPGARVPAGIGAALLVICLVHLPVIELRYDVPVQQVLSRSAVLALAQLPTSLVLSAALILWGAIVLAVPGLAPFLGVAVPILVAHHLVGRSLDRNEALLQAPGPSLPPQPASTDLHLLERPLASGRTIDSGRHHGV